MRFLLMISLAVLVSCGQNGGSSSSSGKLEKPQNEEDYLTEVRPTDLLDVSMDTPIIITGDTITFQRSSSQSLAGIRSTCELSVTSGESYAYKLSGNKLVIVANGNKQSYVRDGEGSSILGGWTSQVYEGETFVKRRLFFVSQTKLIMNTHCEN